VLRSRVCVWWVRQRVSGGAGVMIIKDGGFLCVREAAGRSRILMIGAGFLGGRTSEVGYCVGWCCASLSSLSMCISVVLPALSRPWVSGKGRREGARQGRRSRFEQCFCVASDRGRSRRVRRATGADRARHARARAVDRGPTSTAIVTPRSGWTIARGIGRAGDPAGADRRVTVARPLHQHQSSRVSGPRCLARSG
jgi:hypothetical protein